MKAILYERYGPPEVLEFRDVPKGFGLFIRLALGISRPRRSIMGAELSGEIESIGAAVSKFKVGDT